MPESNREHDFIERVSKELSRPLDALKRQVASVKTACTSTVHLREVKAIDRLDDQIDDIQAKLDDLLTLCDLDDRCCQSSRRSTNLLDVSRQVQPLLARQALDHNVVLEFQGFDALPPAFCDHQQLHRILTRLGTQGIRSCEQHGLVRFWARHDSDSTSIRIGVTDNGVGWNEACRDRLARYFAAPGTGTRLDDSSIPLGLSIAARLCKLNLSPLHLESDRGLGSIFWFDLPTADSPQRFPRWLRLHSLRRGAIQLIRLELERDVTPTQRRDAELLLVALAENDELLLRRSDTVWWLASEAVDIAAEHRAKAIAEELDTLADARATGPDVRFLVSIEKRWDRTVCDQQILDEFEALDCPSTAASLMRSALRQDNASLTR